MSLNASKIKMPNQRPRQPHLEAGSYPARVVQVLDLGLQPQRPYKGEEKQPAYELNVTYELLDEFIVDEDGNEVTDKPRWLSERFPLFSLDSDLAKSTKRYFSLDPTRKHGGDWAEVIGTPCMVVLVVNPSNKDPSIIYNNVVSVSSMRSKEASKAVELQNTPVAFDMGEPDMDVFWKLPQFIRTIMVDENLEFNGSVLEQAIKDNPQPDRDEDTPDKKVKTTTEEKLDDEVPW